MDVFDRVDLLFPRCRCARWRRHRSGCVTLLLTFLLSLQVLAPTSLLALCEDAAPSPRESSCPLRGQFLDEAAGSCKNCTVCGKGETELVACSETANTKCKDSHTGCVVGEEFFDQTTRNCTACTECSSPEEPVLTECTVTADRVCLCSHPVQYFNMYDKVCVVDCTACKSETCVVGSSVDRCECDPKLDCDPGCSECTFGEDDYFCSSPRCTTEAPPPEPPSPTVPNVDVLPGGHGGNGNKDDGSPRNWQIGLIAIGVLTGILSFSACFLAITWYSTRKGNRNNHVHESTVSTSGIENGFLGNVNLFSNNDLSNSSPMVFDSQTALDILRHDKQFLNQNATPVGIAGFANSNFLSLSPTPGSFSLLSSSARHSGSNISDTSAPTNCITVSSRSLSQSPAEMSA